jgi:hypothetical protein
MSGDQPEQVHIPPRPDLRQSLCHTLLAVGFIVLGLLNPVVVESTEASFHTWMMVALGVAVVLSWYVFVRRWLRWSTMPREIRAVAVRSVAEIKQRAISHLMMALLALLLTGFSFLGLVAVPDQEGLRWIDVLLMTVGGVTAVGAVAILSRTLRDLIALNRAKNKGSQE